MSFIDKDQRPSKQKNKHNFIETSVTSSFLCSFFVIMISTWTVLFNGGSLLPWQVGHKSVAYFFFSCHQDLFLISVLQNCSELAFVLGFSVKFGQTCLPLYNFCSHRPLVELLILRKPTKSSWFLEDIRVPFDYKQEISTKH